MRPEDLDDLLTRPSPALVDDFNNLAGDILVLGAGGKMGPSLVGLAARAAQRRGDHRRIIAVSRWSNEGVAEQLRAFDVEVVSADLGHAAALNDIAPAENIIFMVGRKFGTAAEPWRTWWINAFLPGLVADRFRDSRCAVFSTGNVYPPVPAMSGGATPSLAPAPVGEYGYAALARERMFEHAAAEYGTRVSLLRLNYATDLRYGVLTDIGKRILAGEPVDISAGAVNICWQGWANEVALRSLLRASSPPTVVNVTGAETASVAWLATELGALLDVSPVLTGDPGDTALLNNAARTHTEYGYPSVPLGQLLRWTAHWLVEGRQVLDKPTHFEISTGRF